MSINSDLLAHWQFNGDCRDSSGNGNHGVNRGVDLAAVGSDGSAFGAARFDGRAAQVEVPSASESLALGSGDFTLAAWVQLPPDGANLHGDIISKFDPATRTGLNFGTLNYAGVTAAQAHHRNLHFGIDDGLQEPSWVDCGRPGNNLRVYSLAVYNGDLYTGTFEWGADEAGHMYRYAGGQTWEDCGSPDPCNTVASLAVYKGELYGGVSRYKAGGSALEDSPNKHPGGAIYRYTGRCNLGVLRASGRRRLHRRYGRVQRRTLRHSAVQPRRLPLCRRAGMGVLRHARTPHDVNHRLQGTSLRRG